MNEEDRNYDRTSTHIVLTKGTLVPPYRIIDKIGSGGMGEVYLAEDTRLNRRVALKFLPVHLVASADIRQRFMREAQAVAKLNHPNIVTIHDVSEYNGCPYYVMEHIEGKSLHHYCHSELLPLDLIIEYAIQICQGLAEAHRAGIVHRDIKAANIAIDKKGRARILDFGLAAVQGDDKLTRTGSTLGTVAYMSPEQVSGREIDHRSDLFSLGAVFYELITGRTPFRRDSEGATLRAIVEDMPEPLNRYKANVPEKLQDIIMKLLEKDREIRYQSAEGVIADLKRLMYDSQPSSYSRAVPARPKKTGLKIGAAVAVVAVIAIIITFMKWPFAAAEKSVSTVPMIAVLPFENIGSPEDEYFADGMTDEITSRLAGIKGLGVIASSSAMEYKTTQKSIGQIGSELGVEFVLKGTVRWSKTGDKPIVRITPQLVRVSDSRNMWGNNYQQALMEVFAVQADIASQIVDQLGLTLLEKDRQDLAQKFTDNSAAYEYYLKGIKAVRRYRFYNFDDFKELMTAKANLDSAIFLDPVFAQAYAIRSIACSRAYFSFAKNLELRNEALASAQKALQLVPELPLGHQALGEYYNLVETEYGRAMDEFEIAIAERHNDPDLLTDIGLVRLRQGLFEESLESYRKAVELDPLNAVRYDLLTVPLTFNRLPAEAIQSIDRAIALEPDNASFYNRKIEILFDWTGDWDKIKPVVQEAINKSDTLYIISAQWWLYDWMPELPWNDLIEQFKNNYRGISDITGYYLSLMAAANVTGDTPALQAYGDSARSEMEKQLKLIPDDADNMSALGGIYAVLGQCDKAEDYGLKGKEMLSVDKCHW